MQTTDYNASAGSSVTFYGEGGYFHLLKTAAALSVKFLKNGSVFSEAVGVDAGYFSKPRQNFDAVVIESGVEQAIKFAVSDGTGGYNRTVGTVDVNNLTKVGGVFSQSAAVVSGVSGQLLASNSARRLLMVQNNDPVTDVFLSLNGAAASVGTGLKISPGGTILMDVFVPVGGISAITSSAVNNSVIVLEA